MLDDGKYLEPDFLVQDHVGVWSVFELKRPDTIILKNPDRRTDFRAEFSTYIQQCREYANFFVQATGRRQIQNDYSIDVQMYVPNIIVACVDDGETDRDTLRELLVDRGNKVTVQTYTEILDSIGREIDRHTADRANLPGIAVSLLGMFPAKPSVTDQVILDYGIDESRNRLTIRLAHGIFVIVLVDSEGNAHRSEIRRPMIHQSINLETGELKATKTGTSRRVPIRDAILPLLRAMRDEVAGKGRVIQNNHENKRAEHGMPPTEDLAATLRVHLERAEVERAELYADRPTTKRITFYDLRASGITWEVLIGTEHVRIQPRRPREFQHDAGLHPRS